MREIKPVKVGNCILDGKHIYIQSMLNTRSDDIAGSVAQAVALEQAGCEIVRAAIPNHEAIALIPAIKEKSRFRWWRIFISITDWHWKLLKQESTRFASTPAISAA